MVILLSGKAESGKDEFASILKEKLESEGKKVCLVAFADMVKVVCQKYFGWDGVKNSAGRTVLQKVGTEIGRKNNPYVWIDMVKSFIKAFKSEFDAFVITDARFRNECYSFQKDRDNLDVLTVRINRIGHKNSLTDEQRRHKSETDLDNFKFDCVMDIPEGIENVVKAVYEFTNLDWEINK